MSEAFAQSEASWRYAGFDHEDIADIMGAMRSQNARSVLDRLVGGAGNAQRKDSEPRKPDAAEPGNAGKPADGG